MSVSGGLVQQWDVNGGETAPTTPGHHIAFSSDGTRFVLCDKGPPTVRDAVSGTIIATLHSPGRDFSRSCFSPSDKSVAGVADVTIYVWDVTSTPRLTKTLIPDASSISSLVYSSSIISMHRDGRVRFQRIDGDSLDSTTRNTKSAGFPKSKVIYVALQAKEGAAISVNSAGTIALWNLTTGFPTILSQIPKITNVAKALLVDDILTVVYHSNSFSSGWNVSGWDVKAGKMLQRKSLSGDISLLDSTASRKLGISEDGAVFFVVGFEEIRAWSTLTGESTGSFSFSGFSYHGTHSPSSFHLNGSTIQTYDSRGWRWTWDLKDLNSLPSCSYTYAKRCTPPPARLQAKGVVFRGTGHNRIIDATTETEVFRLSGQFAHPRETAWDGRYLVVGYDTGEFLIMDFIHVAL